MHSSSASYMQLRRPTVLGCFTVGSIGNIFFVVFLLWASAFYVIKKYFEPEKYDYDLLTYVVQGMVHSTHQLERYYLAGKIAGEELFYNNYIYRLGYSVRLKDTTFGALIMP